MSDALDLVRRECLGARQPCVTASFQADCVVLLHLIRQVRPDMPVLFLDTHHHFPETIAFRDALVARWTLNLVTLGARAPVVGEWRTSTRSCCDRHKVEPLFSALASYDTWFAALRREQSASRAALAEVEPFTLPGGRVIRKVSPLAAWTLADVLAYADRHDLPRLPLYARGYTSIGCEPCTTPPVDPANPRSGRWGGAKLECGIHLPAPSRDGA